MTGLLAFLFVLGVVVFVHELGHFLVARWHGVRVLTFSLGFGPKLLKTRRGDTEYCISAIPLGGYVKMAGEPLEDRGTGEPDEFLSKTRWQRFQIILAGPVMNFLLAVVVLTGVLYADGVRVPLYEEQPPVVGQVAPGSAAERAGIAVGDRILHVGGRAVPTWNDLRVAVFPYAGEAVEVRVAREGAERTVTVTPDTVGRLRAGDLGVGPDANLQIGGVVRGQPAERAGLQPRDVILTVDGAKLPPHEFPDYVSQRAGTEIVLTVRRGSKEFAVPVTPVMTGDVAMIGVDGLTAEQRIIDPGFGQAIVLSVKQNAEWTGLIFRVLGGFFTRETSVRELAGPIGIAQLSGTAAETGLVTLFAFIAMISLNLGLINLLPIPVLDGGSILILALEGLARRDFSVVVKERIMLAGLVVIVLLMVTVFYVDLMRIGWLDRLMPGS